MNLGAGVTPLKLQKVNVTPLKLQKVNNFQLNVKGGLKKNDKNQKG